MNRVCVFGGSGFLGSHVADALTEKGFYVRLFDKKKSNWLQSSQEMFVGDLLNPDEVNSAVEGMDYVYNFAALADLNDGLLNPLKTINVNILGNANILEACRKFSIKRFIFASTVYINSREGGFYRCSKYSAEQYVEEYQKVFNLDYTILRYGSLYGPRSNSSNGLYNIIKKSIESGVVRYSGNSESLREYIHVEDAAKASVVALSNDFRNQSVVLTGQEPMRVHDLLKMIVEIMGLNTEIEFENIDKPGHYVRTPYSYKPQIGRKYIPPLHVDLGQGLLQLIEYVKHESNKDI